MIKTVTYFEYQALKVNGKTRVPIQNWSKP